MTSTALSNASSGGVGTRENQTDEVWSGLDLSYSFTKSWAIAGGLVTKTSPKNARNDFVFPLWPGVFSGSYNADSLTSLYTDVIYIF